MDRTSNFNEGQALDHRPPRGWIRWLAVVLAAAGWWFSFDLAKISFGLEAATPWLQERCGPEAATNEVFDCRSVLNSASAWIPLSRQAGATRLPTSVLGMGYFAFLGLWYLFVGSPTRSRWARHLLIAAVVFCGMFVSASMIQEMHLVLRKWCAGCLAVHAINAGLFLLTIIAFPWRRDPANRAPHPRGRLALAALAACSFLFLLHLAIALVLIFNNSRVRTQTMYANIVDDPAYIVWQYERQPLRAELAGEQPVHAGAPDAPNHVVVFVDYQCPACKRARDALAELLRQRPGELRITYRHFPLDMTCNPHIPNGAHPAACRASEVVEAARIAGGDEAGLRMRALLYDRISELDAADYESWAEELGIDRVKFGEALASETPRRLVAEDIELGRRLDVEAIPVLYLNGRRLHFWSKIETWQALLIEGGEHSP